jgi:type I restriction enzyme S subunit
MNSAKLGKITENLDSRRIPLNSRQRDAKKKKQLYPYIGANNILDYIDEYIFDEEILCIAEDGGSWGASQICATIYNEKCWVNNHAHVLRAKSGTNLSYLRHYLNHANLNSYITGTTRGKLTRAKLDSIEVPFPHLDDQIRIATLLSRVEALIATRKENLRLLDEFLKSTFLEMFGDPARNDKGWETSTINGLCKNIIDCPHSTPSYSNEKTGYFCVRTSDIVDGYLDLSKTYLVSKPVYDERIKRYTPDTGDIIYSREGGRLGNAARILGDEKICLGQRMMLFSVTPNNQSDFFWALLESPSFKLKLQSLVGGGAAPRVNIKDIKKIVVIKPIEKKQKEFSDIVKKIDGIKSLYLKNLTELESLYGALSQKAFKGELDLSQIPLDQEFDPQLATTELESTISPESSFGFLDQGAMSDSSALKKLLRSILEGYFSGQPKRSFSFTISGRESSSMYWTIWMKKARPWV